MVEGWRLRSKWRGYFVKTVVAQGTDESLVLAANSPSAGRPMQVLRHTRRNVAGPFLQGGVGVLWFGRAVSCHMGRSGGSQLWSTPGIGRPTAYL